MAGQQGQPKYGFGWPDGRLGGLGPSGQREARPLDNAVHLVNHRNFVEYSAELKKTLI